MEQLGPSWLRKEREELKKELLSKKDRIWRFENCQLIHIAKYEKASEKSMKGVAEQSVDKKFMGLYERKHMPVWTEGDRDGEMKKGCWTAWI